MLIRCVIFFVLLCIVVRTIQQKEGITSTVSTTPLEEEYDVMNFWDDLLKEDGIVPQQMSIAPNICITGLFNNTKLKVKPGSVLSKFEMEDLPNMTWPAENNTYYTLIMTHLGLLSNLSITSFKQWQHWLVLNIPGNRVHEGDTISQYKIPVEPEVIGIYTHLFWVFKQKHLINFTHYERWWYGSGRIEFNVWKFAKKYNLTGPVAILHFLSWD